MNEDAFPTFARCPPNTVLMKLHRTVISAFVLLSLASSSCAQTKQKSESVTVAPPQLIWKYDTGG
jgi:hypothetical protein